MLVVRADHQLSGGGVRRVDAAGVVGQRVRMTEAVVAPCIRGGGDGTAAQQQQQTSSGSRPKYLSQLVRVADLPGRRRSVFDVRMSEFFQ